MPRIQRFYIRRFLCANNSLIVRCIPHLADIVLNPSESYQMSEKFLT